MTNKKAYIIATGLCLITLALATNSCKKDADFVPTGCDHTNPTEDCGTPTPYNLEVPFRFPQPAPNPNNPLTVEGIELGRKLFYETKLSANNTQSCASCHAQTFSFTDNGLKFSLGIDGIPGKRNSMAIVNLAWAKDLFWDGRSKTLEEQAFLPVIDEIEMHNTWQNAVATLQADPEYPDLFCKAFGTKTIDSVLVVKAIAQFERTLISANSKFDRVLRGEDVFTPQESAGLNLFNTDRDFNNNIMGADCFHCHGGIDPMTGFGNVLFHDNQFHNNGLDNTPFQDSGLYHYTKNPADIGKFQTTTLSNLVFTAPYMHDGRFATIDEVIDFYSSGLKNSPTIDPLMKNVGFGGVQLGPTEKANLKAFLLTLTDSSFIQNPAFSDPN